ARATGSPSVTCDSSKRAGSTANERPRSLKSARRLGDAEAKTIFGGEGLVPWGMAVDSVSLTSVRALGPEAKAHFALSGGGRRASGLPPPPGSGGECGRRAGRACPAAGRR